MATPRRPKEKLNGLAISDVSIRQPVFITMVMLAIVVFGLLSFSTMPVNMLPDIDVPVVSVAVVYPGAGPESVAEQVVEPIEDAVNTLAGLDHITSNASEGLAVIILEFESGTDISKIDEDVREKINAVVPSLPRDVRTPVIQRFDINASPIMSLAVAGTQGQSPLELRQILDEEIVPLLQRVDGVGSVDVSGGATRQINVLMDLQKLQAYGILPVQISNALRQANANLGLGSIEQGGQSISLRAPSLLQSPDDIEKVQITGTPYRVGDVAYVEDGKAESVSYSRLNGSDAIILGVRKQTGTNTVAVADNVIAALDEIFAARPDLTYTIPRDDSESVRSSVQSSIEELFFAALAAFLVVWAFFRNLRSTIITMIGLPVILIGTFIFMPVFGLTINLITLLALSLCVGLVIDDAIVVRENIFRHMERGETARVASSKGTWEVGLSVLAMTLTIVAVFVPVTFAEGTAGIVFKSFGIVVAVAILLSLVEAFTLAPMMSANVFPNVKVKEHKHKGPHHEAVALHVDHLEGEHLDRDAALVYEAQEDPGRVGTAYGNLLAWTLRSTRNRLVVVGIAVGVLLLSLVVAGGLKFSFFPEADQHQFTIGFEAAPGTTLAETNRVATQAEQTIMADPDVETVIATIGYSGNPERADFFVKLKEKTATEPVLNRVREALRDLPRLATAMPSMTPTVSTSVAGRELQIGLQTTRPLSEIAPVVEAVIGQMRQVEGLVDIDSNYQTGKPELRFIADPGRIGEIGVTNDDIASSVRALINGDRATVLRQNGLDTDVVVRLEEQDRSGVESLGAISIPTRSGTVPLSALGDVEVASSLVTIRRYDRLNQVLIGANIEGRNLTDVNAELKPLIDALGVPGEVKVSYLGTMQQTSEGFGSLILAMALSVLFVYMVLASQFSSFSQPLVIMMAMPFSFIGAFLALRLVGLDLDITGMIGLIMLLGLVVKNSILLVDFANRLRELGLHKHEALRLAGAIRLRPILMTSVALIAGAVPTALGIHIFGSGEGGEYRRGLAWVIIGGMITSTILTLLVVPTVYSLMDSLTSRFSGWVSRRVPAAAAPAETPAAPAPPMPPASLPPAPPVAPVVSGPPPSATSTPSEHSAD